MQVIRVEQNGKFFLRQAGWAKWFVVLLCGLPDGPVYESGKASHQVGMIRTVPIV